MEDREILKDMIREYERLKDIEGYKYMGKWQQVLENLLKENENLKQAAIINKNLYETKCNENKELEEDKRISDKAYEDIIKELNEENNRCAILAVEKNNLEEKLERERYYNRHNVEVFERKERESIPKSLIKEKIEELEEEKKCFYSDYAIEERNNKIQVLQKLLEREEK